jgi:hypothetical protein
MRHSESTEILDSLILNLGKRYAEIRFESMFAVRLYLVSFSLMANDISSTG